MWYAVGQPSQTRIAALNEAHFYRECAPPAPWRDVVACCWEQRVGVERLQRVLPDGHADVLMHAGGEIEVVGLHDQVDLPALPGGTWIRGIRLRPHAVAAALRADASSLRNRTVPLGDILGARQADRLHDPRGLDGWIRSIEPDPRIRHAVRLLTTQPVDGTADALGITPRQLRRLLVAEVGLAPKVFQRVARMQRFLALVEGRGGMAGAAAAAGYADQSHMTREVRHLAGITPTRLLEERRQPLGNA
jgi:AraC-like DNA-binding protein